MNDKLTSALIGMLLAIPVGIFAVSQQGVHTAERNREYAVEEYAEAPTETAVEEIVEDVLYYDVPLSQELQNHIFAECEKYSISPALVIAMIERESAYNGQAVCPDGSSVGLMQIQERWHRDRMERLGCTDLYDEKQNITVGIDYLHELFLMDSDVYWVLMAYNGGFSYANKRMESGNYSNYAIEVTKRAYELERGLENGF